jgi:inner membrane protein
MTRMTAYWQELVRALDHPWRRFALALGLFLLILGIDRWLLAGAHTLLLTGIADETAHLSTVVILLLAFSSLRNAAFVLGCLAGAVVIDLDHIPLYLGSDILTDTTNRPLSHGLLIIGAVLAVALVAGQPWRALGLGLAAGLGTHFLRDMATSTAGAPLLWPLSSTGFLLPYPIYAGILAIAVGRPLAMALGQPRQRHGPGA